MKAMILCAGLGTRLKPWTDSHPKALVPVEGIPMLERVILKLREEGVTEFIVNVHHFADQIEEFLQSRDFGVEIHISDECAELLDTGGAIMHAAPLLWRDNPSPVIIYNVDVLSNACVSELLEYHNSTGNDITMLVSDRASSRKLLFDSEMKLKGWHNLSTDDYLPEALPVCGCLREYAFSGIYVVEKALVGKMRESAMPEKFPIVPFIVQHLESVNAGGFLYDNLSLLDIGKPDTLSRASGFLKTIS